MIISGFLLTFYNISSVITTMSYITIIQFRSQPTYLSHPRDTVSTINNHDIYISLRVCLSASSINYKNYIHHKTQNNTYNHAYISIHKQIKLSVHKSNTYHIAYISSLVIIYKYETILII